MKTRKNKKLLVVVAMVLMIGLVAGMGAMTYSKYITTTETEKTATAAKWGFVVTANATELFGTDYVLAGGEYATYIADNGGVAVNASNIVVAPGTKGSMTFSISGKAEVLARLIVTLTVNSEIGIDEDKDEVVDDGEYFPIIWSIQKGSEAPTTANSLKKLAMPSGSYINANTEASTLGTYTLSWVWPLETGANDDEKADNNVRDTVIGMKAYNNAVTYASISELFVGTQTIKSVLGNGFDMDTVTTSLDFRLYINVEQVQVIPTP